MFRPSCLLAPKDLYIILPIWAGKIRSRALGASKYEVLSRIAQIGKIRSRSLGASKYEGLNRIAQIGKIR
jgi:hypothetical protein